MTTMVLTPTASTLMQSTGMVSALACYVPPVWPDDTAFQKAEQAQAIGGVLVATLHRHLVGADIGYVFRENMATHDRTTLAKASKAGAKLGFFAGLDLCIDVNHTAWLTLSNEQRVALIDHELCHFGVEDTDKGLRYALLSHDVEEFGAIVTRWGLWKPDLRAFGRVVAEQAELFAQADMRETTVDAKVKIGNEWVPATEENVARAMKKGGRDRAAGRDD